MWKSLAVLSLLVIPAVAHAQDATPMCTKMWCQEGLTLNFGGEAFKAGKYTFALDIDDRQVTCTASLPFKSCDGSVSCHGQAEGDTEGVTIGESGCALPPESHTFSSVMIQKVPQHLKMTITREKDGARFVMDRNIDQQCSYPNGKQCDQRPCCSSVYEVPVVWE